MGKTYAGVGYVTGQKISFNSSIQGKMTGSVAIQPDSKIGRDT